MVVKLLLITILTSFFISGCVVNRQKSIQNYAKKNNDVGIIHYIGDQDVFSNTD